MALLPKLHSMNHSDNELTGQIPQEFASLTNLNTLVLAHNRLSGAIPDWQSGLSNFQFLDLGHNQLTGSIPLGISNLPRLIRLYLDNNNLSGTIPEELGRLTSLNELSLSNNQLTGDIPQEIGNLRRLTELFLSNNSLSGSIPSDLGKLSALRILLLHNNGLTGSIPAELSNLSNLERLYLQDNDLTGSIPAELASLTKLREMHLTANGLSGCLPWPLGGKLTLQLTHDMLPRCLPPVEEGGVISIKTSEIHGADPLTVVAVADAINGAVSFDGTTITYTHDGSETTSDSFSYTVTDGTNTYSTIAAVIVTPVNDRPVAVADAFTLDEGGVLIIADDALLNNDTDAEGDTLQITRVAEAENGRISLDGNTITYTHDGSETTFGGFTYTVSDGTEIDTAWVALTVTPVNDPPVATADIFTIDEAGSRIVKAEELLNNDTDAERDTLKITSVEGAVNGRVSLDNSNVTYTHDGSETTFGGFTYTASDGTETDTASVAFTVTPVNDPPVATADIFTIDEAGSRIVKVEELLNNDTDAERDTLKITSVEGAVNGRVSLDNSNVTYTHDGSETTFGGFTYTASDGTETDTASVAFTVTPVNDLPVAATDTFTMYEGDTRTFRAEALLNNDTDAEGDTLLIAAVGEAENGRVILNGDTVIYTHDGSETTDGSFSYTVSDGMDSDTATVALMVTPVNDPPEAMDDSATVDQGKTLSISASALLDNDADAENDTLTITDVGKAANGRTTLSGTTITYEHDGSETTGDYFSYTVSDGTDADTATVQIIVTSVDDRSTAPDDVVSVTTVTPETEPTVDPTPRLEATPTASLAATPEKVEMTSPTPGFDATPTTSPTATPEVPMQLIDNGGMSVGIIVLIVVLTAAISIAGTTAVLWRRHRT